MKDRAKQLMELLWPNKAGPVAPTSRLEPAAFDLDAIEFLNPGPCEPSTLVLAPDRYGRQLIVDRTGEERQSTALVAGYWRVWAEVVCWSVEVTVQDETLPPYPGWLPASAACSGPPDPVGHLSERYLPLGAHRQSRRTVRFPEAVLAAEYTTELWTLLAEHGIGATFTTTMLAKTLREEACWWSVTRQENLQPLSVAEPRSPAEDAGPAGQGRGGRC